MLSYLDVATIESTSHLDGRLSLVNRGGLCVLLEEGNEVFLVPPKIDVIRVAHVESVAEDGQGKATVRFREVDSIDIAKELIGMHCLVDKEDVRQQGDHSLLALAGMFDDWEFEDLASGRSGQILSSWSNAGNLVGEAILYDECDLSITHMIPLADDLITDIDEDSHRLSLNLPIGIFDL